MSKSHECGNFAVCISRVECQAVSSTYHVVSSPWRETNVEFCSCSYLWSVAIWSVCLVGNRTAVDPRCARWTRTQITQKRLHHNIMVRTTARHCLQAGSNWSKGELSCRTSRCQYRMSLSDLGLIGSVFFFYSIELDIRLMELEKRARKRRWTKSCTWRMARHTTHSMYYNK